MVIQRIQTLWLLLAVGLMTATAFRPFACLGETVMTPCGTPAMLIITVLTAVMLFVSIFMFNDLRRQMRVTLVNIMLTIATVVTAGVITFLNDGTALCDGFFMPIVAIVFEILAYRGMRRDHKLLTSADRLR